MPEPWTYENCDGADLCQGDVLAPTDELRKVLSEVHPYFNNAKYLAFIVVTHSCDLVRRDSSDGARYISVAVVRALNQVLIELLDAMCDRIRRGIYPDRQRHKVEQFLERLINQNEQKQGLFYLPPNSRIELGEDAVAFLRVTVALQAQHYEVLCSARRGRIPSAFANKLGWLIGNLYSRIGTPDWPDEEKRALVDSFLGTAKPRFVNGDAWSALKRESVDLSSFTDDQLVEEIAKRRRNKRERVVQRFVSLVKENFASATPGELTAFEAVAMRDDVLKSLVRD